MAVNHVTLTQVGTLTENLAGTLAEALWLQTHKRNKIHWGTTYTSAWTDTAGVLHTSSYTPTEYPDYFDSDESSGSDPDDVAWMTFVVDFTEAALDAFATMAPLVLANLVVPGSGIVYLLEIGYGVMGVQWGYDLGQALYALGTGTDPATGRELTDKEYAGLVAGLLGSFVGGAIAGFAVGAAHEVGTRMEQVAAGERCSLFGSCFVAGTPMDVVGGPKPIEQVRDAETHGPAANRVWNRDQFDPEGPVVARRVLRRFVRVSPVLDLDVGGRRIGTTREHPFYAAGKGWTPAGELIAGDRVLLKSGGWLRVDAVADGGRVETVYNLEVEDDHTYFVGADEWGFAVWAHNADYSITWDKATGEWVLKDEKGTERGRGTEKEPLQAQGKARAWETADETFIDGEFQVGKHGDMPTPRLGRESHHGVMSKWMAENFNDYNPKEAPAVLMSAEKHNATRGVFNKWAAKMEERMGGPIDWTQVSEKQMRSLSEDMFDAAGVPQ